MNNKEIELKFVINKDIKNKLLNDLQSTAVFVGSSRLIDTYYIPYFKEFEINGETMECVRIRESETLCVLTYKKIHREANPIYCDEYETVIDNKTQMENILLSLGFSVQMVIDKTRQSYSLDKFEFDFDSVENLGELLEIELKDNSENVNAIYEFVSKYGLSEKDVTYEGIQVMMKRALNIK